MSMLWHIILSFVSIGTVSDAAFLKENSTIVSRNFSKATRANSMGVDTYEQAMTTTF